jgi:hypothetical protein
MESLRIEKWLVSNLRDDEALIAAGNKGVNSGRIPSRSLFPRISFNLQSGGDTRGTGGKRLMSEPLYLIKAIQKGAVTESFQTLVERMDEIIQNKRSDTFEGYVFSSVREQEINYVEPGADPEEFYKHVGGLYRIYVSKL